jgi:hypothetical protein
MPACKEPAQVEAEWLPVIQRLVGSAHPPSVLARNQPTGNVHLCNDVELLTELQHWSQALPVTQAYGLTQGIVLRVTRRRPQR